MLSSRNGFSLDVICSFLAYGEHPEVGRDWVLFLDFLGCQIYFYSIQYILNTIIVTMKWYRHHDTRRLPVVQWWSLVISARQMRTFLHLLSLLLLLFQIIIGLSSTLKNTTRSWTKKASPLNARKTSETVEMSPWD